MQLITQSPSHRGLCSGKGPGNGVDAYGQMQKSVKEQCCLKGSYRWAGVQPSIQCEPPESADEWLPSNGGWETGVRQD